RYIFAAELAVVESDAAVGGREQRVVLAHPDVDARIDPGPALTHDNVAADHVLSAELLHAKATAGRIATVARGTACFLMCHDRCSLILWAEPRVRAQASFLGAAFLAAGFLAGAASSAASFFGAAAFLGAAFLAAGAAFASVA